MTTEQIAQIANTAITVILLPILSAVAAYIVAFFKAKTEQIKKKSNNQEVDKYLDILNSTVYDVVNGLQQELVDDIKAASADGSLSTDEQAEILDKAKKRIYSILGEKGQTVLKEAYGDLEKAIQAKIHKEVRDLKMGSGR